MRLLLIGNSDGIGWALTRRRVALGDHIVSISRSPLPSHSLAPGHCQHHVLDVTDPTYADRVAELSADNEFDACVYLVGIGLGFDPERLSLDRQVIDANFQAVLHTTEACLPPMLERGRGQFIALSSIADQLILDDAVGYCTSKAALSRYLTSLGLALRRSGVTVTNVRFGFVDTKMAHAPVKPGMISADKAARLLERCLRRKPLQYTYPKSMALAALMMRAVTSLRVWLYRGR